MSRSIFVFVLGKVNENDFRLRPGGFRPSKGRDLGLRQGAKCLGLRQCLRLGVLMLDLLPLLPLPLLFFRLSFWSRMVARHGRRLSGSFRLRKRMFRNVGLKGVNLCIEADVLKPLALLRLRTGWWCGWAPTGCSHPPGRLLRGSTWKTIGFPSCLLGSGHTTVMIAFFKVM